MEYVRLHWVFRYLRHSKGWSPGHCVNICFALEERVLRLYIFGREKLARESNFRELHGEAGAVWVLCCCMLLSLSLVCMRTE